MSFIRVLIVCALAALGASAAAPDCVTSFSLSATGTSAVQSNRQSGCIFWTVAYNAQGFSGLSLVLQSAPDAGNTPGSWSTFDGTVIAGFNPNTATDYAFTTLSGYVPWLRMNLTSVTGSGTVVGVLYGYKDDPGAGGGGSSTPAGYHTIDSRRSISATASGLTEILPGSPGIQIFIGHWSMSGDSVINVKLVAGTGSNCGTGTFNLTDFYRQVDSLAFDWGAYSPLAVPAGNSVCVNFSGASNWGGLLLYGVE